VKSLTRQFEQELPSEGCCTGALQIPPNGPVLFMNDHPITGGYPVIAAVALYHLDLIAQIPAGCHIQFRKISDFMDVKKDA
jgi:allophanate hydrolase subunit 2